MRYVCLSVGFHGYVSLIFPTRYESGVFKPDGLFIDLIAVCSHVMPSKTNGKDLASSGVFLGTG
jgi:hypothetical protein